MNTWNPLLESYQQWVYKNTLATVKCHIQHLENPTPAEVISNEAAHVDNAIHLECGTSKVAFEESEIRSTHPNILIDIRCTDDHLHFGIPCSCNDYDDDGDEINRCNEIPSTSRRQQAAPDLERCKLVTRYIEGYDGGSRDNADADEEDQTLQANNVLTQTLED
jgi:hypothetical protein